MAEEWTDVYRYRPEQHHCREGMALLRSDGLLFDTFWDCGGDMHPVVGSERESAQHVFALADYDELDGNRWGAKDTWIKYHPEDRQAITSQHGLRTRYFIRKGAEPDLATQIENAKTRLSDAESVVKHAEWELECRRRELAALTAPALSVSADAEEGK